MDSIRVRRQAPVFIVFPLFSSLVPLHIGRPNIEIEAKFGLVLDKGSGSRTVQRMGVLVETSQSKSRS